MSVHSDGINDNTGYSWPKDTNPEPSEGPTGPEGRIGVEGKTGPEGNTRKEFFALMSNIIRFFGHS